MWGGGGGGRGSGRGFIGRDIVAVAFAVFFLCAALRNMVRNG